MAGNPGDPPLLSDRGQRQPPTVARRRGLLIAISSAFGVRRIVHPVSQLIRYGVVAGCGYLLAIGSYSGELAIGIAPYVGLGIAFVVNGLFNFALIRLWVFPPSGRRTRSDLARFSVVAGASFLVNYAVFAILYSLIGLPADTSQRLGIVIAAPVTFLGNRVWSFRSHTTSGEVSR